MPDRRQAFETEALSRLGCASLVPSPDEKAIRFLFQPTFHALSCLTFSLRPTQSEAELLTLDPDSVPPRCIGDIVELTPAQSERVLALAALLSPLVDIDLASRDGIAIRCELTSPESSLQNELWESGNMRIKSLNFEPEVQILFLDKFEENQRIDLSVITEIMGYAYDYVCFENIALTRTDSWHSHAFSLLRDIESEHYLVRNVRGIDLAMRKQAALQAIHELWLNNDYIFATFVQDRYLPFKLGDKMLGDEKDWKNAYGILNYFNWNLQFSIGERSYFASPDKAVIERIIELIAGADSSVEVP